MRRLPGSCMLALLAVVAGCTSASTTNTPRSSTEQLLVANAIDQSLDKVNYSSFAGYNVYFQEKYIDCVDKNYLIASVRHRLMNAGARLVDSPEKADIVLEARTGVVGTSANSSFLGIPEITLPGMLTLPEVRFMERKRQEGTAKIGMVAFDPKTNEILGNGGVSVARADDTNWYVVGIGPYQDGSILREVKGATSGQAAVHRTRLPNTIAFDAPRGITPPATRIAEDPGSQLPAPPPTKQVSPASNETFEPAWTRPRQ